MYSVHLIFHQSCQAVFRITDPSSLWWPGQNATAHNLTSCSAWVYDEAEFKATIMTEVRVHVIIIKPTVAGPKPLDVMPG